MFTEHLSKLTVAQLKEELSTRDLETTGKKVDLVNRLNTYLGDHADDALAESFTLGEESVEAAEMQEAPGQNGEEQVMEEENTAEEENGAMEAEDTEAAEGAEDAEGGEGPEGEGEGEGEEATGDDAAEGEGEEEDETAEVDETVEETKKDNRREKSKRGPGRIDMLQDRKSDQRLRTVVLGPIVLADLENELIKDHIARCVQYFLRMHFNEETSAHDGHIEFRFRTYAEAQEAVEKLKEVREDVVAKQLSLDVSAEKVDKELIKKETGEKDQIENRTVVLRNLPESVTDEQLKELFADAPNFLLARDKDHKPKGYAYIEFDTSQAGQDFLDKYREKSDEEQPKLEENVVSVGTLMYIQNLVRKEGDLPEGVLSDSDRSRIQQALRNLQQKIRTNTPNMPPKQHKNLQQKVNRLQNKLKEDIQKRKENDLPLPKQENKGRRDYRGGRGGGRQGGGRHHGGRGGGGGPRQNMGGGNWGGQRGGHGGQRGGQRGGRQNQNATANAVNLLVGLSNMFKNRRGGGRQQGGGGGGGGYNQGGANSWGGGYQEEQQYYSNDAGSWNQQGGGGWNQGGASNWNQGGYGGGGYGGGFGGGYDNPNKRRRMSQGRGGRGKRW